MLLGGRRVAGDAGPGALAEVGGAVAIAERPAVLLGLVKSAEVAGGGPGSPPLGLPRGPSPAPIAARTRQTSKGTRRRLHYARSRSWLLRATRACTRSSRVRVTARDALARSRSRSSSATRAQATHAVWANSAWRRASLVRHHGPPSPPNRRWDARTRTSHRDPVLGVDARGSGEPKAAPATHALVRLLKTIGVRRQ